MTEDAPMRRRAEVRHRCPVCHEFMWEWDTGAVPPVVVERCQFCRGVLVSEEQLDQLDESMWVDLRDLPSETVPTGRRVACPVCSAPMTALRWSGPPSIEIDLCSNCRLFWLDDAELDGVRTLVDGSHQEQLNRMLDHVKVLEPSPRRSPQTALESALRMRRFESLQASFGKLLALFRRK